MQIFLLQVSYAVLNHLFFFNLPISWLWLNAWGPLGKDITFELQKYLSKLSVLRFCPWYNNFLEEKSVAEYSADFIKSVLLGHAHILWGVWFSWTFEWLTYWHAHLCKVNFKVRWTSICRRKVKSTHRSVCAKGLTAMGFIWFTTKSQPPAVNINQTAHDLRSSKLFQ